MKVATETKVVIIGGGVIGASLAYHLTLAGCRDVVLLEQNTLAGGTTWHAAGLVGRLRTSTSLTAINKYSAELYAALERETGHSVGWKQVGSLIVGRSADRMIQLRRTAAMAECFGVETHIIDPKEVRERWPLLRIDDIQGGAWLPHDGKVVPKEVVYALAKGAKSRGATFIEHARVIDVLTRNGRACGVRFQVREAGSDLSTPAEPREITAEVVVLTGGMWARELGLRVGVSLPLHPVEHHYAVSHPIPGAFDELPVGRDPDLCLYFRGEGNAVMLGAFQAESKPWMVDRVPDGFSFQLLEPDWEKFAEPLKHGKHRIPALETSGFEKFVNGPESFTPDNQFLMGETAELPGLFVACGFNSVGIASAGGAGKFLTEWILEGQPSLDLWSVDVRRFGPWANNRAYLRARVVEVLGLHYQMAWPNREFETARGVRRSALHERLAAAGAAFGAKGGWERPNWFARADAGSAGFAATPEIRYGFGRQNWFANHAAEHRAARETVALFDQSSFAKLMIEGSDAAEVLQRLCANRVDVAPGRIVYTALLNDRGGFESDVTVVRLDGERFYLVTGTTQGIRDADWIRRHVNSDESVAVRDVTAGLGVIGVMGPHARRLLQRVTDADLSNAVWPFGVARQIAVGMATARALRMTYVGELGWELHLPMEQMVAAYDALWEAGQDLGVVHAGHYAINSLRLEKGYRAFGAELSPDETPLEAGLSFAVNWAQPFIGRAALERQRSAGLRKRLGIFVLQDPQPVLWGSEPILRNGRRVGYTTSGSYGHTVGGAIGMGYVRQDTGSEVTSEWMTAGSYEILVNGDRVPARLHLKPPYDPERIRILA
ncbi:MAG: FAD-dependent oxidoreductase [Verrucomicrobiales bacterium]|nr:FAD-dependent oxidoreductase [Verrucomicrobiales bacterium]